MKSKTMQRGLAGLALLSFIVLTVIAQSRATLPPTLNETIGEATLLVEPVERLRWLGLATNCVTFRWEAENIAAIWVNDSGTGGTGEERYCSRSQDDVLSVRLQLPDESTHNYAVPHGAYRVVGWAVFAVLSLGWLLSLLPPFDRIREAAFPPEPPAKNEVVALTSIRTIAALLVVLHHYSISSPSELMRVFWHSGYIGVPMFFALSGFLITLRYADIFAERITLRDYTGYMVKRIARIYPLYLIIFFGVAFTQYGWPFFDNRLWLYGLNLQAYFPDYRTRYIGVAWTLNVEMTFYMLAPIVFWHLGVAARRMAKHRWIAYAGVLVLWVSVLQILAWWLPQVNRITFGLFMATHYDVLSWTIFGRFTDFALGIGVALLVRAGMIERLWASGKRVVLATWVGVVGFVGLGSVMYWTHWLAEHGRELAGHHWLVNYLTAASTLILVVGLLHPRSVITRAMSWRPLVYYGYVSYALYLVHYSEFSRPVIYALDYITAGQNVWFYPILVYVLANLWSIPFYEWIEKPARSGMLRWYKGFDARYWGDSS